jgi:hypothetical protein
MLGTWGSNYGGVSSAIQNPALIANSKLYADFSLVGASFGYYHNDSYIEETNSYIYDFLHNNKYSFPKQDAKTNFYSTHHPDFENGFIASRVMGPAFMLNSGRNSYAISYAVREFASLTGIPDVVGNITKHGIADSALIAHGAYSFDSPIRFSGMVWGETAFTYARTLKSDTKDVMTLGVTLKYLTGYGGAYMYIDNIGLTMTNINQLSVTHSNAEMGMSLPYNYSDGRNQVEYNTKYVTGKGFGTDLGFTIQHNSENHYVQRFSRFCEQEFQQYDYRFSVSLLDLGYISFKDNVLSGTLSNTKPFSYNLKNFVFTSTQNAIDSINYHYNPKAASIVKKKFTIVTPTAVSFQYDKMITDNIYVTAAGIIGIPISKSAIKRPSQLAIIPRWESDILEVSLPLSLYEYTNPRVGLSARIFFLTLGTDRLISLRGVHDYYGYDFYASIRLNFMKFFRMNYIKGQCRESLTHPCF